MDASRALSRNQVYDDSYPITSYNNSLAGSKTLLSDVNKFNDNASIRYD